MGRSHVISKDYRGIGMTELTIFYSENRRYVIQEMNRGHAALFMAQCGV